MMVQNQGREVRTPAEVLQDREGTSVENLGAHREEESTFL
jgi:hypothetical protein